MESYKGNSWLNLRRISERKTHLSKKTGPAQCKCGPGAPKGKMNQVKVDDYIGVKELSAIFVAKLSASIFSLPLPWSHFSIRLPVPASLKWAETTQIKFLMHYSSF